MNDPASSSFGGTTLRPILHATLWKLSPSSPSSNLSTCTFVGGGGAFSPFLSLSSLVLLGVTFQINYLHPSPYFRVCFVGNPTKLSTITQLTGGKARIWIDLRHEEKRMLMRETSVRGKTERKIYCFWKTKLVVKYLCVCRLLEMSHLINISSKIGL